jgi:shikimate dehydrogenase
MVQLGLVGYPLHHSLSPHLHHAALRALTIPGEYKLFPVLPFPKGSQEMSRLLSMLRDGELLGLNVTIPHKQTLMPLLDGLTSEASEIGAVNTIFCQDERLIGDNTDAPGFWVDINKILQVSNSIPQEDSSSITRRALVLGAGGSARAVVYTLVQHGWEVVVAARRLEQAQELAAHFQRLPINDPKAGGSNQWSAIKGQPVVGSIHFEKSPILELVSQVNLIVNATPIGMWPEVEKSPWPEDIPLPSGAMVYDLVYNPAETMLVRQARNEGLMAKNGLGMLVEQAALAFERWLGQTAPRQAMWKEVL